MILVPKLQRISSDDDMQKITAYFLIIEGFSVGIGDMIADDVTNIKIKEVIENNKLKINEIMQYFI